jgi:hypothetical protein
VGQRLRRQVVMAAWTVADLGEAYGRRPEFAKFPRFRELNMKTLLCYQAELDNLGQKLRRGQEIYQENATPDLRTV